MSVNYETLKSRVISSIGWKLLEKGGSKIVSLLVQIVMARLLAPEEFGMLAIMLVFVNIGNVIVQSGLNTALVQDPDTTERDYSTVFWLSLGISLALYVLLFWATPLIAAFYSQDELIWPLRVLGLILIINAYNAVQIGKLTRDLEMKKIFLATIVSTVSSSILGIGSALLGVGVWALVVQQVVYQLSNVIAHAVQIDWYPRQVFQVDRAKKLFVFGWKLLVSGILNAINQSFASLVIGKQFGGYQLGLVSQGEKYPAALGTMIDGVIQPVMLSAVSKVQNDIAYVRRLTRRALRTSTYFMFPVMFLCAVVAPSLIPLLLGEQWVDAVPFFQIYCIAYALLPIHSINLQVLAGLGRSDLFLALEILKVLIGVACVTVGAIVFNNIYCFMAAYLVASIVSSFINAVPNKKIIRYSYTAQIRDIFPSILLAAGGSCCALLIANFCAFDGIVLMLLQMMGFSLFYLGVSAVFQVEEFLYLVNGVTSHFKNE